MAYDGSVRELRGIIPPMFTPLKGLDELDAAGLERLIEHILDGGVHGLFILGTTGEALSLSYRLRREVIERTCRQVAGRVPVLVGVTDTAVVETVELARFAAKVGADALVVAAPPYYPVTQGEMLNYVEYLARELPLPTFLYNMPSHTKFQFEPETVRSAMRLDKIVGIKDSSGDMGYFHNLLTLLDERPDFNVLIGPEALLGESVMMGGHGGVCGGANLFPRLFVAMYDAAAGRNIPNVLELQKKIVLLSRSLYQIGNASSSLLMGLSAALSCLGICNDELALPYSRLSDQKREEIRRNLDMLRDEGLGSPNRIPELAAV
ncbi:MAG: dihydrodipicolinate synthase family protein [Capsulimonadaceae bacterium]|nr:dihydrodipicolinate synthase family protein [Capsulimonadaceae bacterium]